MHAEEAAVTPPTFGPAMRMPTAPLVVQRAPVQRAPQNTTPTATALPNRYKPLLDRIKEEEDRRAKTYGIGGWHLPVLYKLEEVAEAAEAGDLGRTKAAVSDFLAAARKDPLDPASAVLLGGVPLTLVSRIYLIGLGAESKALQDYFFGKEGSEYYEQPSFHKGLAGQFGVSQRIVDDAIAASAARNAAGAETSIDLLLVAFKRVTDSAAALDPKTVEKNLKDAREEAKYSAESGLSLWTRDPDWNAGAHFSHLLTLLPRIVVEMERSFQLLLDAAVADLETGKGSAALDRAQSVLEKKLFPAFDTKLFADYDVPRLLDVRVTITRSDFESRTKRHLDYFDESKKAPSAVIQAYSKDETYFSEKDLTIRRLYEVRANQIATLRRLFGLSTDKTKAVESAETAAAIKSVTGFRLHDDDSWRVLLLEKFRAARKRLGNDWDALSATIDVLRDYLAAFTIHTPYNIDEFGDNYLGRTFPRALTGQFIEDCGVYALKIAYALSLVRKELGLIFRMVALPVHVALIVSFDDVSKGAFFVNNDQFTKVPGADLEKWAKKWQETDPKGKPLATPQPLDVKKFFGEIAAATFIERADVPYRVEDVPDVPDVKDVAKRHAVLWDFYHKKVLASVTAPTADDPQPELRYLSLLEHEKQAYNFLAVPFWIRAQGLFKSRLPALTAAVADLASSDAKKKADAVAVLAAHKKELLALSEPLRKKIPELDTERQEVSEYMAAHPAAVAKTAHLAPWLRLGIAFSWELRLDEYVGDDLRPGEVMDGKLTLTPPWETSDQLLQPMD